MSELACRRVMFALTLVGLAIAAYLTVAHYAHAAPICALHGGCETVAKSRYAMLGPLPVSLWGLGAYATVLACCLRRGETARLAGALVTLVGVAFSAYLTYLEVNVIHAICQWCVGSAVTMTLLCGFALARVWVSDNTPRPSRTLTSAGAPAVAGHACAKASARPSDMPDCQACPDELSQPQPSPPSTQHDSPSPAPVPFRAPGT